MKQDELAVLYTVANAAYNSVSEIHKASNPFYRKLGEAKDNILKELDMEEALTGLELEYEEPSLINLRDVSYEKERIILGEIRDNFRKKFGGKTIYHIHLHIKQKYGVTVPVSLISLMYKESKT